MSADIVGRVAVVTGSGSGIGRAIAVKLAEKGAKVVLVGRTREKLERVAAEIGSSALVVPADVGLMVEVKRMVSETIKAFGKIDILVNNVGGAARTWGKPFTELCKEDWDRVLNLNVYSTLNCSYLIVPYMIKQRSGKMINLASFAALHPFEGTAIYSLSKAGLVAFTRVLAKELAKYGISVNAVAPGLIETEGTLERLTKEQREQLVKATPLGRKGLPSDVADVVTFLASDDSRWLTGQCICISGGAVMH